MNKENTEKLFNDFPNLYRDKDESLSKTLICWGFSFDDGWNDLVYDLSAKLEECILRMPEEKRGDYRAVQAKEKFGFLRFYMTIETKEMSDLIAEAERKSAITCEICGSEKGEMRKTGGWLRTLCLECKRK